MLVVLTINKMPSFAAHTPILHSRVLKHEDMFTTMNPTIAKNEDHIQ